VITARASLIALALTCGARLLAEPQGARPLVAAAAAPVYQRLLPQIERIRIFDHHAHPGFPNDPEVDPAPVPPSALPYPLRPENPEWAAAAASLFQFPYKDFDGEHGKWLVAKKASLRRQRPGPGYLSGILDKVGIETSIANRITMNDDLDARRFKWVFYADSFMYPFDNAALAGRNSDQAAFMPMQTKLLARFRAAAHLETLPPTLDGYLGFVSRTLEDHKARGAVAMKFEAAYFRSLAFSDPTPEQASAVYERYRAGGVPGSLEYTLFQDFVFRRLAAEGGRLHLPVHIHSSVGAGDYFSVSGVNVLNLEPLLRDARYASTTFVLIHGGYPFDRQAIWLAAMKNVWLDTSGTGTFLVFPDEFKTVLRRFLEAFPDKITFGSDAFPLDETIGVEEGYWVAVHSARTALAGALAEMVAAGEVTEAKAMTCARGYLHDNAAALYK
jgi:predicted TIM-barrel fold metal-dependent hydrolase